MTRNRALIAEAARSLREFLREHGAKAKRFGRHYIGGDAFLYADTTDGRRAGCAVALERNQD